MAKSAKTRGEAADKPFVERRSEPRFQTSVPVKIVLLAEGNQEIPAFLANVSGKGMQLTTTIQVPLSAPVRVDANDQMFLGEVCYCQPDGKGFIVGLLLEQVLCGMGTLHALAQRLLQEEEFTSAVKSEHR